MSKYLAFLILIITLGINIWLYAAETKITADPNDNIFQYSLVYRTNWVWENYGCPLSLSCLPNLTDHVVTAWAEGYPLPFYYSHIPQISTVASYKLIVHPILSVLGIQYSLYQWYHFTVFLLMILFPISVYAALRVAGFSPVASAVGAFFSAHYSTDGLYGIDPPSFLWRGWGLTSQLYGMIWMPLGIAYAYKALSRADSGKRIADSNKTEKLDKGESKETNLKSDLNAVRSELSLNSYLARMIRELGIVGGFLKFVSEILSRRDLVLAIVFLTFTTAGHLGLGILALLSTVPFLLIDFDWKHIFDRIILLGFIGISVIFLLSYWIIPVLLNNNYHMISFWDPIWKFNSYGWYEVLRQFWQGEIFDWQRMPVVTIMVTIGLFVMLLDRKRFSFGLLFIFWMLMYFGKTTWGGLIDLIPGMADFHQHRFVVSVQMASLFLLPAAFDQIVTWILQGTDFLVVVTYNIKSIIQKKLITHNTKLSTPPWAIITSTIIITLLFSYLGYKAAKQSYDYSLLNTRWIGEANSAFHYDEKNFNTLVYKMSTLPPARTYAGRPGNWGHDFRLGSTQLYMQLAVSGMDMTQFLPETWSPLSENEQNFDERTEQDYDLLNIRYVVSPKRQDVPDSMTLKETYGPFQLYEIPTTGWFDIVTAPMGVHSDKTNFINTVHYWWMSYARRWKMHPLISVEKNPNFPTDLKRVITMKNEIDYTEGSDVRLKNIWADYPFTFPQATPSGQINSEKVTRQSYSGVVTVPQNCGHCYVMFKMSYHPDWEVKVDGVRAQKVAVFPFYLATPATPGTHTIEFEYHPNTLKVILITLELITISYLLNHRYTLHKRALTFLIRFKKA